MILLGATWADLLAFNLRQAGALWAAWAGGAASMRDAFESDDGTAAQKRAGLIEQARPERPRLVLVP